MALIEKTILVDVDVDDYILNYGDDPYSDGRSIEEAIECDIENSLVEGLLDFPISHTVEIA